MKKKGKREKIKNTTNKKDIRKKHYK